MINFNEYEVGQHRLACPSCARGGRDKTAGLKIDPDGSGVLNCFRCSYTESFKPERGAAVHRAPTVKAKAQVQQHHGLSDWGWEVWNSTQDLSGIAAQYLRARRCVVPECGDLRWHPSLKHPSGYVGPALVALITDTMTNKALSLHRTWITPTGKAGIDNPRLLLANHCIDGGVIRLTPDDEVNGLLGIGEGIETALSLAHAPLCVWATIDAGHLAKFPVLRGISTLIIAVDQDDAGMAAATDCADRWTEAGKTVLLTNQLENDLNNSLEGLSYDR